MNHPTPAFDWDNRVLGTAEAVAGERHDWQLRVRRTGPLMRLKLSGWLNRQSHRALAAHLANIPARTLSVQLELDTDGGGLAGLWLLTSTLDGLLDPQRPIVASVRRSAVGAGYLIACSCFGITCDPLAVVGLGVADDDVDADRTIEAASAEVWHRRPQTNGIPIGIRGAEQAQAGGLIDVIHTSKRRRAR